MAEARYNAHLNLVQNRLLQAVIDPQSSDPSTPVEGQIWYNSTAERLRIRKNAATVDIAVLDDVTAGSITSALWDAQSVIVAVADNTPVAVTIAADAVLGRIAGGNVGSVSAAQMKTMLTIPAGSIATETFVTAAIDALINGASAAYDTLQELATALTDNDSDIAALTSSIAGKNSTYAEDIGDAVATTITVTHGLGTLDVAVAGRSTVDDAVEMLAWTPVSTSAIDVEFNTAPALNSIRVVVQG